MNLRKVKTQDLYPVLDEIQKAFKEQYNFSHLHETVSDTYGKYQRELCFVYNYSSEYLRKLSNELQDEFHKLHCGWASVYIKDFPENYPDFVKDQLGAEIVAYYISTERLNDLPINDDLRLARFIIKNKENILNLMKGPENEI